MTNKVSELMKVIHALRILLDEERRDNEPTARYIFPEAPTIFQTDYDARADVTYRRLMGRVE